MGLRACRSVVFALTCWLTCSVACSTSIGCSGATSTPWTPVHLSRAQRAGEGRIDVASLPAWTRTPTGEYRQELSVAITEGVSGKGFEGRGAIAVRPGKALRMVLLGPGGTTAMDVWIAGNAYRVSIPAMDKVMRGDVRKREEVPRGLPIALFHRWILAPFVGNDITAYAGRLEADGTLTMASDAGAPVRSFVSFAHRDDVFEARARLVMVDDAIVARAWWFRGGNLVEKLDAVEVVATSERGGPIVTQSLEYTSNDPPMKVHVDVAKTELLDDSAPLPPATFADPDAAGT